MVDDTQKLTQKIKSENLSITYYYHQNIVIDIVFAFFNYFFILFTFLFYFYFFILFFYTRDTT